jgi:hypothetical protein
MLALILKRALLAAAIGTVPGLSAVLPAVGQGAEITHAGAVLPAGARQIPYSLQLLGRDSAGRYNWSGVAYGEIRGEVTVRVALVAGSSQRPGFAQVRAEWIVRASPSSESFEASLSGTVDVMSGETHLSGAVVGGAGRGRRVETSSWLLYLGPGGAMSDFVGMMTISASSPETTASPSTDSVLVAATP